MTNIIGIVLIPGPARYDDYILKHDMLLSYGFYDSIKTLWVLEVKIW